MDAFLTSGSPIPEWQMSLLSAVTDLVPFLAPGLTCLLQAWSPTQDGETPQADGPMVPWDGSTWEAMALA